jgi:hypothetical protein
MSKRIVLRRDESGAIEGLPLQLMIAVIIAGIALAIILGWVLSIQTPSAIGRVDVTPDTVSINGTAPNREAVTTVTFTVRAYDQKGNAIPGIAVSLRGAGVSAVRLDETDGIDGAVTFASVVVRIPASQLTAKIAVSVEASGFPSATDDIIVVRG